MKDTNLMESNGEEDIRNLHRNTIKVYYLLLRDGKEYSPMEVKDALSFSSRSASFYHLNKLYLLSFIQKTQTGKYYIDDLTVKDQIIDRHVQYLIGWLPNYVTFGILNLFLSILTIVFWVIEVDSIIWLLVFLPFTIINAVFIFVQGISFMKGLQPKLN